MAETSSISALGGLLEILDRSIQPFGVDLLHHRLLGFVRALYAGPLRRPCSFGSRLVSLIHLPLSTVIMGQQEYSGMMELKSIIFAP
jgi:hypothetical protein